MTMMYPYRVETAFQFFEVMAGTSGAALEKAKWLEEQSIKGINSTAPTHIPFDRKSHEALFAAAKTVALDRPVRTIKLGDKYEGHRKWDVYQGDGIIMMMFNADTDYRDPVTGLPTHVFLVTRPDGMVKAVFADAVCAQRYIMTQA